MSIQKEFDAAIMQASTKDGTVCSGYVTSTGKTYPAYMNNVSWAAFTANMSPEHVAQYRAGSGGELDEKNGRPPKMASFASSSQMIYKLSNNIPGFVFEKQLATAIGGIANLDGYLEREHDFVFLEAKCREPYSHIAIQTIKQNYEPVYAYLQEKMARTFSCAMEMIPNSRDMRVAFFCNGDSVAHFDIKQMICHLLGIANEMLTSQTDKPVLFLYLLYNPKDLQLSQESKQEIMHIYTSACKTACNYCFEEMFCHIVDFLLQKKSIALEPEKIQKLKSAFRFALCDQSSYTAYLNS